jgi:Protein of unknown function (DUF4038)/Putative collagen-binding domain of a collagenase
MKTKTILHSIAECIMLKSAILNCALISIFSVLLINEGISQTSGNTFIKISDNGHYFLNKNGQPFLWQGDTEWELFRYFTVEDARALLIERKKQGFNVIQVMVNGVFPEWGSLKGMKPWEGMNAWKNDDPFTPYENYFNRADSIIAIADRLDIMLVIGVYHARDNDAGRITLQNVKQWTSWLATRYTDSRNIIYSMYPHADIASVPVIINAVRGILESDKGNHLITMHPDPSPASSSFMHTESWLSFNTLQTWSSDFINYDMVRSDYVREPLKPVVNGEARYEEEDGITPFEVRRAAYWSYLAGGFYSYGHRDNWNSPQTWRNWYSTPGALQMKIMGEFLRSIEWWKIVPDQLIFEKWIKGNAGARSSDGDWILAYLTDKAPVTIKLNYMSASGSVTGWWINPLTGERIKTGTYKTSENRTFMIPKGWQDAVLFLEN